MCNYSLKGWIEVQWDHGGANSYRMGAEGKYDLDTCTIGVVTFTVFSSVPRKSAINWPSLYSAQYVIPM